MPKSVAVDWFDSLPGSGTKGTVTEGSMFDVVSDLHFDNAMKGSPPGLFSNLDVLKFKSPDATMLLVVGDTAETLRDAVDYYNAAARHYELVVAVLGNHEEPGEHAPLDQRVVVLDLCGHAYRHDRIAFVGGCPLDDAADDAVIAEFAAAQADDHVDRVVLLLHFVPSKRFSEIAGMNIDGKCISILERLSPIRKPTLLAFGHVHLTFHGEIDGMTFVSNPRGYRGKLRDGSYWRGSFLPVP
jgi:hypothetical protein